MTEFVTIPVPSSLSTKASAPISLANADPRQPPSGGGTRSCRQIALAVPIGCRDGGEPAHGDRVAGYARSCDGRLRAAPRSRDQRGGVRDLGASSGGDINGDALDVPAATRQV